MPAISYKNIPVWIGLDDVRDFSAIPNTHYVLAKNVSIQNQNKISPKRILNNSQETQFDGYGTEGSLETQISVTFVAETYGSGVKYCLDVLTGDRYGYVCFGNDFYGRSYLNNVTVNIQPFAPVEISANFTSYRAENISEFVLIEGDYTWKEARSNAFQRGGRLAILNTEEKSNRVPNHSRAMWIGLTDEAKEGEWRWVNNTLLSAGYINWSAGQPDNAGLGEHYAQRLANKKWNDSANDTSISEDAWWRTYGYILEYDKIEIINTVSSKPRNISIYNDDIVYGHNVLITSGENISDMIRDSISYSISCNRTPSYTIGSLFPRKVFLDSLEKEISIKSANIAQFVDFDGYDGSIFIDLKDNLNRSATTISFNKARVMSQNLSIQENDSLVAEIKAKEVIL